MYLDVTNDYQFESQLVFPPNVTKNSKAKHKKYVTKSICSNAAYQFGTISIFMYFTKNENFGFSWTLDFKVILWHNGLHVTATYL